MSEKEPPRMWEFPHVEKGPDGNPIEVCWDEDPCITNSVANRGAWLEAEVKRLRGALEYYADRNNFAAYHVLRDNLGNKAREALNPLPK
jgi:hypothetical protein